MSDFNGIGLPTDNLFFPTIDSEITAFTQLFGEAPNFGQSSFEISGNLSLFTPFLPHNLRDYSSFAVEVGYIVDLNGSWLDTRLTFAIEYGLNIGVPIEFAFENEYAAHLTSLLGAGTNLRASAIVGMAAGNTGAPAAVDGFNTLTFSRGLQLSAGVENTITYSSLSINEALTAIYATVDDVITRGFGQDFSYDFEDFTSFFTDGNSLEDLNNVDPLIDADTISGGDDVDVLGGGAGADTILGQRGNDIIFFDEFDIDGLSATGLAVNGGEGFDIAVYSNTSNSGQDQGFFFDVESASIEAIDGGLGSDTIRSSAQHLENIFFRGMGGADQLIGGGGRDTLYGGDGSDEISGGARNDLTLGGDGDDSDQPHLRGPI